MPSAQMTKRGNCFEATGTAILRLKTKDYPSDRVRLVHGVVTGQGPLSGRQFCHGWLEVGDDEEPYAERVVFDLSNEKKIVMPADEYYSVGKINPKLTRRYTVKDACLMMSHSEHFGPWDIIFRRYP